MGLKERLQRTKQDLGHRAGEGTGERRSYALTLGGSPLRALLLLPWALFGLFIAFLTLLPVLVKAAWNLRKVARRAEELNQPRGPAQAHRADEVIEIEAIDDNA